MNRRAVRTLAVVAALTLSACGFQLRGASQAGIPFRSVYIGVPETSLLGAELKRNLRAVDTKVVSDPKAADAILEVLSESRDSTVSALNTQGRIRELSLFYRMRFRVLGQGGKELLGPTEITLKRDISYNESQAIAKEKEQELLYRDMQSDIVQQIMRRLAALPAAQG